MPNTPDPANRFQVGDFAIYKGKTYSYPGEVVALTTSGQVVVKAFGDMSGNYAGMLHIYGPGQLEPYEMSDSKGSPFLVIDPERDLVAQVRAFCELHPEKSPLGLAQLHAFLAMVDEGERQKPPQRYEDATPFLTQDGNRIYTGVDECRHNWLVDGLTEVATCEYCGQDKPI